MAGPIARRAATAIVVVLLAGVPLSPVPLGCGINWTRTGGVWIYTPDCPPPANSPRPSPDVPPPGDGPAPGPNPSAPN